MCTPDVVELDLAPDRQTRAGLAVHIPADYVFQSPRFAISADVTFNGRRLGQVAEAVIELERE